MRHSFLSAALLPLLLACGPVHEPASPEQVAGRNTVCAIGMPSGYVSGLKFRNRAIGLVRLSAADYLVLNQMKKGVGDEQELRTFTSFGDLNSIMLTNPQYKCDVASVRLSKSNRRITRGEIWNMLLFRLRDNGGAGNTPAGLTREDGESEVVHLPSRTYVATFWKLSRTTDFLEFAAKHFHVIEDAWTITRPTTGYDYLILVPVADDGALVN